MRRLNKMLLAASLAALTWGCEGPEGPEGAAGAAGEQGENGEPGDNGQKGDPGEPGTPGAAGPQGEPGAQGEPGVQGEEGPQGAPGKDAGLVLVPQGVIGIVTDGSGDVVPDGTVYFVPAADVKALAATTVAVGSSNDEPLEDLIAANATTYPKAPVGEDGVYAVATLPAGRWFVTFVPATEEHLPGGSLCRTALDTEDLAGERWDIAVSSAVPADATYVGSGRCVTCHGKTHIARTLHRVGIWSPYEQGLLQDPEFYQEEGFYGPLDAKFTAVGTTVYFYDFDGTRGMDKYKTSESAPAAPAVVSFTATARKLGDDFQIVLHNAKNPADPDVVMRVDFIYGGGLYKQRYATRVENASGAYHVISPLQFQHEGQESYGDRTRKVWRDYNGGKWYDEAGQLLKRLAPKDSFEKNCASCHSHGTRVTGSDATVWQLDLVSDPLYGDFDFDRDGVRDETNLSCEACHGPGSAHWDAAGQGRHIVNPKLLTPERDAMICGQCHSRPKGAFGTDSPVNADGFMMVAGTSREQFLAEYATTQLDGAASDYHADGAKHSKSHHQQYSDFIRSAMYKNENVLMSCADCHDPHARKFAHQLRADRSDNVASCGACHTLEATGLAAHIDAKLGAGFGAMKPGATCVDCHMPKTAKTGAGRPGISGHWQDDISSHIFDVPSKSNSSLSGLKMSTPYTNACGTCHQTVP